MNIIHHKEGISELKNIIQHTEDNLFQKLSDMGVDRERLEEKSKFHTQLITKVNQNYAGKQEHSSYPCPKDAHLEDNQEKALEELTYRRVVLDDINRCMTTGTLKDCLQLLFSSSEAYRFTPFVEYTNYLILQAKNAFFERNPLKQLQVTISINYLNQLAYLNINPIDPSFQLPSDLYRLPLGDRVEVIHLSEKVVYVSTDKLKQRIEASESKIEPNLSVLEKQHDEKYKILRKILISSKVKEEDLKYKKAKFEQRLTTLAYEYGNLQKLKEQVSHKEKINHEQLYKELLEDLDSLQQFLKEELLYNLEINK